MPDGRLQYWRYTNHGVALGAVGLPHNNDGKYVALCYYDIHGNALGVDEVGEQVARYATRLAAMSAVEERTWIRCPR